LLRNRQIEWLHRVVGRSNEESTMASKLGWVDFAEDDRERMLRVVDLFREQGTQDELGVGTIRDTFADHFFPGTSTIQTRARYFLFVPWIYKDIEDREIPSAEVAVKARRAEIRLIHALLEAGEKRGVSPSWGYGRIYGELRKLGYDVHWQTVRRVMLDAGLLPDPDKPCKSTWKTFLASHWESIAACDFFSIEAWGLKGLTRYLVFFVIDLATRCSPRSSRRPSAWPACAA
jgi:hypothetical protein